MGTGAGSFGFTNLRYRTTSLDQALEPHDLPLQFLSETGVVGFALFVGGIGWLIVRSRRRPGPELALALALPAYVLHGLLDIGWDFAAVSAPVFLIAGALATRPSERPHPSPAAVLMASGVALAVVFSLFAVWFGDRWTGQAEAEIGTDNAQAVDLARSARSVNPLLARPAARGGRRRDRATPSGADAPAEAGARVRRRARVPPEGDRLQPDERRGLVLARALPPRRPALPAGCAAGPQPLHGAERRRTRRNVVLRPGAQARQLGQADLLTPAGAMRRRRRRAGRPAASSSGSRRAARPP